ncbi:MAG: Ppx/GppA family phosphatase [Pontiellaceae bacterium]|nr:Ppx/GppA family phosphatase [Pontiellaceae bacterium]MBN2785390.1 Ppx/GppA family phosphatase [Pontiellaceae bacterium]
MVKRTQEAKSPSGFSVAAVIDVGSTSIRMAVAQIHGDGHVTPLDNLNQSVAIGRDTFTGGRISRSTIEDCVKVLRNFTTVLREYGADMQKDVRAVATSAVREARNRDEFLDRIYIATGINVEAIDGTEVNRLTFLAIKPLLKEQPELRAGRLMVAEVGGGSTELLGLNEGQVSFAHTYRMGAFRLRETLEQNQSGALSRSEILEMEIEAGVRQFRDTAGEARGELNLLLMGSEARMAAGLILKTGLNSGFAQLKLRDLERLAEKVMEADPDSVARQYNLSVEEAQGMGPALKIYCQLSSIFRLKKVYVCGVTLRDGLLAEIMTGNRWSEDFEAQILSSVMEIGRKYHLDEAHAECVTNHARALFRALEPEHGLGYRYEVLLVVAALLHDVGMFIGGSSHHKHSKYLIENSDIFGLSEQDLKLVAIIARYHRRALPRPSHAEFSSLTRENRLIVSKLASILRAADALDRSHTQALRNIRITLRERELIIVPSRKGDFIAEKRALSGKGRMLEQVYGRTAVLRTTKK